MIEDKQVTGHSNLVNRNNTIVNVDKTGYETALRRRRKDKVIDDLILKNENLEKKVAEIDDKLSAILEILRGK